LIREMLDRQIKAAVKRFLDRSYGPASFAEFAVNRLGVEFDASDFRGSDYETASRTALDKATRDAETKVVAMIEENLGAEDPKEWNWQALANQANTRWNVKTSDRQLKQIGKEDLSEHLKEHGTQYVADVDLSDGAAFLAPDWGVRSICDWARLKFSIKLSPEELTGKSEEQICAVLRQRVMALYRQKEIEFPVTAAMQRFMSDRAHAAPGGQRYNREGLFYWAQVRFPHATDKLREEDFRTESRAKLHDLLLNISRELYSAKDQEEIDAKWGEALEGAKVAEPEDARELAEWMKREFDVEIPEASLTGMTAERARQILWNAFDAKYRPEMRSMERGLLLSQLDTSWKNHLYTMDHLRSGIGLYGYAQEDPKIKYKQEGMKEFRLMWEGIDDKVTESVFRMEESEAFAESVWAISATIHETAPRAAAQIDQAITNQASDKKPEPIRNRGEKVGRNDPCPCGS